MSFQRKKVAAALAYLVGAGCAMSLPSAYAQAVNPDVPSNTRPPAPDVIRVEVTGSNIKRIEGESGLPVQVYTREDIEREGIQTAAALVERLAVNSTTGGIQMSGSEGSTGAGISVASLRGLGAQRTLVLLNGRRVANNSFTGGGVDLNTIPVAAIERVEVLTDGASAVYGADAIAGVINFILRKDYTGAEANAYYGDSQAGGGYVERYNVTGGWGDLTTQKFNVLATFDYQKLGGLKASERPFSSTAFRPDLGIDKTSGNTVPANVSIPGIGSRNPGNPECAPPFSFPTPGSPLQCRFDYASVIDILPPQEIWTGVGRATWQFLPDHQLFVEGNYADSKSTSRVSPSPISQATILSGEPILIPPSSPFYPHAFAQEFGIDGQPLNVAWRSLVLGPRTENDEVKQSRVVGGVQGNLFGWDYEGAVSWNQNISTAFWPSGWTRGSLIQPILDSGQINVFSASIPPDQLALLNSAVIHEQIINSKGTISGVDFHASKDIFKLPAGALSLAAGTEYHKEEYEFHPSEALLSGDVPGSGGSLPDLPKVSRNVYAAFVELNAPIVKGLEADVAVRYDHYSDFGGTTNPKVSLRWTPIKQLLLRGSWGMGFRAPTLSEKFSPPYFSSTGENHDDPVRCPVTHSSFDCNTQFNAELGGNPNLKPERSTQYSLGGVWEPVPNFSASADYWWVEVKDVVGTFGEDTIFDNFDRSVAQGLVVRFPPDPAEPGLPGRINYIVQTNQNFQKLRVDGFDVDLRGRFPQMAWGRLGVALHGTYYFHWEQTDPNTGQLVNYAGQSTGSIAVVQAGVGYPGSLPRWKHTLMGTYDYGPWEATLSQTFQSHYQDEGNTRTVGAYSLWDLSASYKGLKNWTFSAGIKNLFDRDPPASAQGEAFQVGYDPTYADPRGRFFWGAVKYVFK